MHTLNLPKDITNIEILPLSDLHVGDAADIGVMELTEIAGIM